MTKIQLLVFLGSLALGPWMFGCDTDNGDEADDDDAVDDDTGDDDTGDDDTGDDDICVDSSAYDFIAEWQSETNTNFWEEEYDVRMDLREDCSYNWHITFLDTGAFMEETAGCNFHEYHSGTWLTSEAELLLSPVEATLETTDCPNEAYNEDPHEPSDIMELYGISTESWTIEYSWQDTELTITEQEPGADPWLTHVFQAVE